MLTPRRKKKPIAEIQSEIHHFHHQIADIRAAIRNLAEELEQYRESHNWERFDKATVIKHTNDHGSLPLSYRLHGWITLIESEDLAELEEAFKNIIHFGKNDRDEDD